MKDIIDKGNKKWKGIEEGVYLVYLRKNNKVSVVGKKWDNWRVMGDEVSEGLDYVRLLKEFCFFLF